MATIPTPASVSANPSGTSTQTGGKISIQRARGRGHNQANPSDISFALTEIIKTEQNFEGESRELRMLGVYRGSAVVAIRNSFMTFMKAESRADEVAFLRIYPGENIQAFSLHKSFEDRTFAPKSLVGILEVLSKGQPVVIDNGLETWADIFTFALQCIVLIPIPKPKINNLVSTGTEAISALAFGEHGLTCNLTDETAARAMVAASRLVVPLIVSTQQHHDTQRKFKRLDRTAQTAQRCEKEVQDLGSCINVFGLEIQSFFGASHCVVFVRYSDDYDPKLIKYCSFGGGRIDAKCPNRNCHTLEEQLADTSFPAGYASWKNKCVRINDSQDLIHYCGNSGPIHSVGGCIVKNIMCFPIDDISNDMPLIIEVSDKKGGFTETDEKEAEALSKLLSPVLSSGVLLDIRKRVIRRCVITNELLTNIKTVQFKSVKHLLDLQFRYTGAFRRSFFTIQFVFKHLSEGQYSGIILYMFTDLGFISRFKMRRASVIRFILSIEQGYKDNPYHNWKHACTVAHFAFIMLKKFELQKDGYLRDVEALAFFVACLCQNVDHRGVNSHFNLCVTDPYHIYKQEEGLMERHHVAVTLQVLSSEECNIVENLSDHEYNDFIELLQWNILATDISKYLHDQHQLFNTMSRFDKTNSEHRKCFLAVIMTVSVLSETLKPWNDYILTVKCLFSEFFCQGDEELKLGFIPSPMMDRRIAYIPYIEMKFLNEIVRPAYQMLAELIPKTAECLRIIDYYKELWLVTTQIFDSNTQIKDPLNILDLPALKEESLKLATNPELEKEASRIRQSLVKMGTFGSLFKEAEEQVDISAANAKMSCWRSIKSCICCLRCRQKALIDAALVRQTNRENEFMEERSDYYERKRSYEQDLPLRSTSGLHLIAEGDNKGSPRTPRELIRKSLKKEKFFSKAKK